MTRQQIKPRTPVPRSSKQEEVYIGRKDKPDIRFMGTRMHTEKSPGRERWTQLEVWVLENGDWVAVSMGMSDKTGEVDIGDAVLIKSTRLPEFDETLMRTSPDDDEPRPMEEMQRDVLAFWGWTWLAKQAADKLGWSYVEQWS